jgi:hypothetical protein
MILQKHLAKDSNGRERENLEVGKVVGLRETVKKKKFCIQT